MQNIVSADPRGSNCAHLAAYRAYCRIPSLRGSLRKHRGGFRLRTMRTFNRYQTWWTGWDTKRVSIGIWSILNAHVNANPNPLTNSSSIDPAWLSLPRKNRKCSRQLHRITFKSFNLREKKSCQIAKETVYIDSIYDDWDDERRVSRSDDYLTHSTSEGSYSFCVSKWK